MTKTEVWPAFNTEVDTRVRKCFICGTILERHNVTVSTKHHYCHAHKAKGAIMEEEKAEAKKEEVKARKRREADRLRKARKANV